MLDVGWHLSWSVHHKSYLCIILLVSLCGLVWVSSVHGGWVPGASIPREPGHSCIAFMTTVEVTQHHRFTTQRKHRTHVLMGGVSTAHWKKNMWNGSDLLQTVWKMLCAKESEREWVRDKLLRWPERSVCLWHSHAAKQIGEALHLSVIQHCPTQRLMQDCQKFIMFMYSEREKTVTKCSKLLLKLSRANGTIQ